MKGSFFNFFATLLLLFSTAISAYAQNNRNQIGLQSDNDAYLTQGSDRYYTNGFFLFYRHALEVKANSPLQNKVLGIEVGQKIFNAQSGQIPNRAYVDRPIAGYLYAGATLNLLYKNESNLKLGVQVGTVGPGSLANESQNFIHNTFGLYPIIGWQYQVKNAAILNVAAEYNRLLARDSWIDLTASAYANAGTGFTGAGVGPLIRLGNFNQLFNSESTQSSVSARPITKLRNNELFFYYKPLFNVVAYDATIQGGLGATHNDPNEVVDKITPMIFSQEFGVTYAGNRWIFNLAALTRGKESRKMFASHQWASIKILYRLN